MKTDRKKLMLRLLLHSVILIVLYFWVAEKLQFPYIMFIYLAVGAVLGIYYLIYNRGFVGRNTTPDMLPDTMSLAEKEAFLADCRARNEKSKWVLTILIPIILTFLAEMVYLFLIPQITGIFS